ncbi:PRKCSH domain-containing protein [Flavobacterium rakeshii]|uniref:PRKCSH domain-containing protein n=1 Tax=Flavobacterium rakeshii TaxID=1038845 RepID=UPI002E7B1B3D|nr:PRKCSH domain-containing protein [Flavobacterium rakeshii]MEE1899928.1 PRKCSH domain-containing protein [Flavobacterium rakeshii]
MKMKKAFYILLLFILSGCFMGGTWEDNDDNWERIFYEEKPENITVNNSWFWQSSHWTYEYCFFIEIKNNPQFISKLIEENNLGKVENTEIDNDLLYFFSDKPEWFIPRDIKAYDVWKVKGVYENKKLFLDRQDGTIFLTDFSV